jgi:hypothetical protein
MDLQHVTQFFQAALESSFYLAPREPGLTYEELREVGRQGGFQDGEIGDALLQVVTQTFGGGSKRLIPNPMMMKQWAIFPLIQNRIAHAPPFARKKSGGQDARGPD